MTQKCKPILFKPEMVLAIQRNLKTQTRRLIKPQPPALDEVKRRAGIGFELFTDERTAPTYRVAGPVWAVRELLGREPEWKCPYGKPGDMLWVRETWGILDNGPDDYPYVIWKADRAVDWCDNNRRSGAIHYVGSETRPKKWRPPIHMPRWASRLTLLVTDIRAQRLQDITEQDARAEGVTPFQPGPNQDLDPGDCWSACNNPGREHLASLEYAWNEMHGWSPNSWASNPWVWAITFEVTK